MSLPGAGQGETTGRALRELVVVGATPAGLSLAIAAKQAGLESPLVLAISGRILPADAVGRHGLEVRAAGPAVTYRAHPEGVAIESGPETVVSRVAVDARVAPGADPWPGLPIDEALAGRVHRDLEGWSWRGTDVLVLGEGEPAAVLVQELVEGAANVVLAFSEENVDRLSLLSRRALFDLEADRRLTVFWRSRPDALENLFGYPTAVFTDRRTPDLQFDHVVLAFGSTPPPEGAIEGVYHLADDPVAVPPLLPVREAWDRLRALRFPDSRQPPPRPPFPGPDDTRRIGELRDRHYNATITHFDPTHSDLWILRVRPDVGDASHLPGQYATLSLGYWERRIDDVREDLSGRLEKLIRRSYSISSPIFDSDGYLVDAARAEEIELYIVLVPPSPGTVPGLTPRLALKRAGDRIHLGPKIAGRYTLAPVTDPSSTAVFLATGTGEAPHNAMIVELLRKGHFGPIVSAVSVRYSTDLAYLEKHRELERRYPRYTYLPLTTRDPDQDRKLYIQDLLTEGILEDRIGSPLDPGSTHVFLCGNPAMIGLPEWRGDRPAFPEPTGAAEILLDRGFTLDRRRVVGNVHYEEFW